MPIGDAKLRPGSSAGHEIQARSGFMQNRIESVDFELMPGSGKLIITFVVLAAWLHVMLERYSPGLMLDPLDFVRCRSRLWLGFG